MFHVQRFTDTNGEDEANFCANTREDLINKLLERAKSKVKQKQEAERDSAEASPLSTCVQASAGTSRDATRRRKAGLKAVQPSRIATVANRTTKASLRSSVSPNDQQPPRELNEAESRVTSDGSANDRVQPAKKAMDSEQEESTPEGGKLTTSGD